LFAGWLAGDFLIRLNSSLPVSGSEARWLVVGSVSCLLAFHPNNPHNTHYHLLANRSRTAIGALAFSTA